VVWSVLSYPYDVYHLWQICYGIMNVCTIGYLDDQLCYTADLFILE